MSLNNAKLIASAIHDVLLSSGASASENGYALVVALSQVESGETADAITAIDAILTSPKEPLGNPMDGSVIRDLGYWTDGGRIAIADALKAVRLELSRS